MTIYHMPESKSEEALRVYLTSVPQLSGNTIATKFSKHINDDSENGKSMIGILANNCEPDELDLGNWTVNLSVFIRTPIAWNGSNTNIQTHDQAGGIVTDELSKLLNEGVTSLSGVSGLTVDYFKFGNRTQNIEGDYIITEQLCEMVIQPS